MKNILVKSFPFAITIALWYMSAPRFNPMGALALIPIFYYMWVRPQRYWFGFGLFACFLLDYNANTLFLFCSAFLLTNALNFQYGIFENEGKAIFHIRGFAMFMGAISTALLLYALFNMTRFFGFTMGVAWMCCWLFALYIPFVSIFRRVSDD